MKKDIESNDDSDSISLKSFLYYQKPLIGVSSNDGTNSVPIQIIYPSGEVGIGVPINDSSSNNNDSNRNRGLQRVTIASGPEDGSIDQFYRRALVIGFVFFAFINFIITILLYAKATTADPSKVEFPSTTNNPHENPPNDFQAISIQRRYIEKVNFAFTLIIIMIGTLSSIFQNVLGLSAYSLAITLNFILSPTALPYFVYSARFILDFIMLYIALLLRSKLVFSYLVIRSDISHRIN
jgi:hypothetical protein